jgi:hypothetical protein
MRPQASGESVDRLLREAARWRLTGLLLGRPRPGWREEISALAAEVASPALAEAVTAAGEPGASEGAYLGLLGPGGPISPREVSHRPLRDPGRLLAEIATCHRAFAFRASAEEPADHVAVAADFAGYLALKEAFALAAGRTEEARTTREARERHVAEHVAPTARGMSRRCEALGTGPRYLPAALRALCELAGVDPAASDEEAAAQDGAAFLRPGIDDTLFDCGAACAERRAP